MRELVEWASDVWPLIVPVAVVGVSFWIVRTARLATAAARRRRTADDWLLWGATPRPSSELLDRRAAELLEPKRRATLARSLAHIEREARGTIVPGAVPLNTRAIRRDLVLLRAVRTHLEDPVRPVTPRGIVLVDRLLTEPGTPMYAGVDGTALRRALREVLAELDSASLAVRAA